jgi:hypothetical protein
MSENRDDFKREMTQTNRSKTTACFFATEQIENQNKTAEKSAKNKLVEESR